MECRCPSCRQESHENPFWGGRKRSRQHKSGRFSIVTVKEPSKTPAKLSQTTLNRLHKGDCVKLMKRLEDGCIDLVFADPPFNIGYGYDEYDDRKSDEVYLNWCRNWIREVQRILKPTGSFWIAINDKYVAELKLIAQREIGFIMRNWVIWYYTFGANCSKRFSRTHTHLLYFTKDPKRFTFNVNDPAVRIPSSRLLDRGPKRANPAGKLPDDTWILKPQCFQNGAIGFLPEHDTWFFPRVAGNFKERQKFHPCHMPEQILARIIRCCSNEKDLVFDPFTGSGTTLAVAKKLNRRFLGSEMSANYAEQAWNRLKRVSVGDPLHGRPDPVVPQSSRNVEGSRTEKLK